MTLLTCTVCNTSWVDESLITSKRSYDLEEEKKVDAPCSHGFAFLVRQFDLVNDVWYYKQIDFVRRK